MKKIPLNFVTALFFLATLTTADLTMASTPQDIPSTAESSDQSSLQNRQLIHPALLPFYAPAAYNQMLLGGMQFGAAPYAFTPYSMYHMNPFMNPYFAMQMPYALQHHPFGPQMLNYMTFMNPLMFAPLGFGNTWNMGEFGMGTPKAARPGPASRRLFLNKAGNDGSSIELQSDDGQLNEGVVKIGGV